MKDNKVADFHSSVKTSAETAVVKSFSEAVHAVQSQCGSPNCGFPPVMNKNPLKSVVKDVVDEEDSVLTRGTLLFFYFRFFNQ